MTFLVLGALSLFSHFAVMTVVLIFLLGLFGMATNPILIGKAVGYAGHAPTLASRSAPQRSTSVRPWDRGSPVTPGVRAWSHGTCAGGNRHCRALLRAAHIVDAQGS